ncbi:MAG: indolepyruvate ferredoxin oxidoreductase [Muribaculaceae bacterium]|nr:indolepyruvate ferredoxin oxidoreductase [Muribaculaceae bacterium]
MKLKKLLLGDEALALGAINAGLSGAYAYPGTPSTEILEFVQQNPVARERAIHSHWSSNEKTAVEEALGMSFCGRRSMVSMKHVGLNVAADPFVNSAMTGANGGMLVISADDPSMHSSQNEQDSRFYASFALLPVLEPRSQQQAYDMAAYGFALSEEYGVPVMVRMVTRLAHSRANVEIDSDAAPENALHYPEHTAQWVLMPGNSRRRYPRLIETYNALAEAGEHSPFNTFSPGSDRRIGILASGIAANYVEECFDGACPFPMVVIGQYPLPVGMIGRLADSCDAVLVVEEGQPVIEKELRGLLDRGVRVYGKLDGHLPRTGELTPDSVAACLASLVHDVAPDFALPAAVETDNMVMARPPALCQGCGHRDVYAALNAALAQYENAKVFGDIGCYTLGWLAPFNAIDTVVDMGASITMAKGAADAGQHPVVAVIGDSTFTHSGMTGLLDAVNENSPVSIIISDNLTTGMTGGQDSQGTGKLEQICLGLGVSPDHLHTIDSLPRTVAEMQALFAAELEYQGVSVIIARRECIQTARRHKK